MAIYTALCIGLVYILSLLLNLILSYLVFSIEVQGFTKFQLFRFLIKPRMTKAVCTYCHNDQAQNMSL